jgi:hypothetical protein
MLFIQLDNYHSMIISVIFMMGFDTMEFARIFLGAAGDRLEGEMGGGFGISGEIGVIGEVFLRDSMIFMDNLVKLSWRLVRGFLRFCQGRVSIQAFRLQNY